MTTWQPIASAPKDGSLFIAQLNCGSVFRCHWDARYDLWIDPDSDTDWQDKALSGWIPMPSDAHIPEPNK